MWWIHSVHYSSQNVIGFFFSFSEDFYFLRKTIIYIFYKKETKLLLGAFHDLHEPCLQKEEFPGHHINVLWGRSTLPKIPQSTQYLPWCSAEDGLPELLAETSNLYKMYLLECTPITSLSSLQSFTYTRALYNKTLLIEQLGYWFFQPINVESPQMHFYSISSPILCSDAIFFLDLLSCLGKVRVTLPRKTEAITSPRIIYIRHQIVSVPTAGRELIATPTNALGISFTIHPLHQFILLAISLFH